MCDLLRATGVATSSGTLKGVPINYNLEESPALWSGAAIAIIVRAG